MPLSDIDHTQVDEELVEEFNPVEEIKQGEEVNPIEDVNPVDEVNPTNFDLSKYDKSLVPHSKIKSN